MMNKRTLGFVVLFVGVILLLFTFFNAYIFLQMELAILASSGFVELFSEALGPLIATCIRIMYLAIMGWIGSVITVRGVQLLKASNATGEPKDTSSDSPVKKGKSAVRSSKQTVKGKKAE